MAGQSSGGERRARFTAHLQQDIGVARLVRGFYARYPRLASNAGSEL